ncbi:hypothetical protein OAA02_00600 [bacterium]|nr:hypothetical protein [bacterium]
MKARLEDGKIVKYSQIPNKFKAGSKLVAGGGRNLPTAKLEQYGFFDVIVPTYDPITEVIYNLHFDNAYPNPTHEDSSATREVFTYDKKTKVISETVAELKTKRIEELKKLGYDKLQPTDFYVTRKSEKGTAIPSATQTERDAIRANISTKETEINALTTKASILKYDINF